MKTFDKENAIREIEKEIEKYTAHIDSYDLGSINGLQIAKKIINNSIKEKTDLNDVSEIKKEIKRIKEQNKKICKMISIKKL